MTWLWLLDYQIGIVNEFIAWTGLNRIPFFGAEHWAIPTVAAVNIWRDMGYTALLVFAGLQTIPGYVYEAASIDGSTEWRSFWRITLPLLRPVLALVLVVTVTGSFQVFDTVAVTTKGGPVNASRCCSTTSSRGAHRRAVRLRLCPVGHPVHHPHRGGARAAEAAQRRRVGPIPGAMG